MLKVLGDNIGTFTDLKKSDNILRQSCPNVVQQSWYFIWFCRTKITNRMTSKSRIFKLPMDAAAFTFNIRVVGELEDAQKWRSWMRWGSCVERKEPEGSALHPGHENSPLSKTRGKKKKKLLQFNSAAIVSMRLLRWGVHILLWHLHNQPCSPQAHIN